GRRPIRLPGAVGFAASGSAPDGHTEPAVDDERLAGDVRGLVAEQEERALRDLPRRALAAGRDPNLPAPRVGLGGQAAERRVDQARHEQVDAQAWGALDRGVAAERLERGLRGGVRGIGHRLAPRQRADEHDRGALAERGQSLASALAASRSATATAAPSRANSTDIARPLPGGGSSIP